MKPLITIRWNGAMQVCVPKDYTDEQILKASKSLDPRKDWKIKLKEPRLKCVEYPDKVHVTVEAL